MVTINKCVLLLMVHEQGTEFHLIIHAIT